MTLRLPNFWSGMSFTAKAAYLCSTNQAKDYSHACQILRSFRRRPRAKPTQAEVVKRMEQQNLW